MAGTRWIVTSPTRMLPPTFPPIAWFWGTPWEFTHSNAEITLALLSCEMAFASSA